MGFRVFTVQGFGCGVRGFVVRGFVVRGLRFGVFEVPGFEVPVSGSGFRVDG